MGGVKVMEGSILACTAWPQRSLPNRVGGLAKRIVGYVRVPCRRLRLRVTEKFPDNRESKRRAGTYVRVSVAKVMEPYIGKTSANPDACPRLVNSAPWLSESAGDDKGVAFIPSQTFQKSNRAATKIDCFLTHF
jgi:hypothetical protein